MKNFKIKLGHVVLALVLMFVATVSANAYTYTTKLMQGSSGSAVMELQTALGVTPVDGSFGPITKAAVMAFQTSKALTADGIVGPMTGAALAGTTVGGSYPAGCTSNTGYSTTTGASCATNSTLPAGCTSTMGFSPTTGVKCDGGSTGGNTGTLEGEGSIKEFSIGSTEESSLSEGQSNMELISFDVELENDGSLKMDRFDLYMGEDTTAGSESTKPWDYFAKAYLMADGEKIATMDVNSSSAWSEYDTAGTLLTNLDTDQAYRLRFTGLSYVLKSDETTAISVAFDAVSNLDSADETADWNYGIASDSFRFMDATGFVFADGNSALIDSFSFDTALEAALEISSSNDDPDASVIEVDDSVDTNGVVIGIFEIEETEDVDVNITEMTVTLATSDTITDVVKKLYLHNGETKVGEETVNGTTVTFDNIDLDIVGGETVELTVTADLDDTNAAARYQNADTLSVSAINLTEYTDEYDNDEGDITESGSYAGQTHALYSEGIRVTLNDLDENSITIDSTNNDRAELIIKFNVEAFGADMHVVKAETQTSVGTTSTATAPSTTEGVGFHIQYAGTSPLLTETTATTLTSTATEGTNAFLVEKGANNKETFTLKVVVTNDGTPDLSGTSVRAILAGLGFGDSDSATADSVYTFNLTDYKTDYAIIAD